MAFDYETLNLRALTATAKSCSCPDKEKLEALKSWPLEQMKSGKIKRVKIDNLYWDLVPCNFSRSLDERAENKMSMLQAEGSGRMDRVDVASAANEKREDEAGEGVSFGVLRDDLGKIRFSIDDALRIQSDLAGDFMQKRTAALYGPKYCENCKEVRPVQTFELEDSHFTRWDGLTFVEGFTGSQVCTVCHHAIKAEP